MDDTPKMQDPLKPVTMDDEEYEDLIDEISEIRELENMKMFLETENGRLISQMERLTRELEGVEITASASKAYMDSYEKRRRKCSINVEKLIPKKDLLVSQADDLHLRIHAVKADAESSLTLKETLEEELGEIKSEKTVVLKRFQDVKTGLQQIARAGDAKLPHLIWYDTILKQILNVFAETQNRMEVSLIMKKR